MRKPPTQSARLCHSSTTDLLSDYFFLRDQANSGAARGLCAHFTASVCNGSILSHLRHLRSVLPSVAATAFIRFLQCGQRVASMGRSLFSRQTRPWNKSSKAAFIMSFPGDFHAGRH
jgi:hypothetical protein